MQVYLCAIPGTMNIKILLSLSSVHVVPQYSESPLCYKGTVQEKGGAEVSWFPLSVSVNVRKCSVV